MFIDNIDAGNALALGPMAGVTDLPFRVICKNMGCDITYTEMVSAKAILYKNKNTKELLKIDESEHPVGVQLFGSDPDIMADICRQVSGGDCDFIDVNMGCPVPKIVNNGEGSFLLTQPDLVREILTKMVKASNKPVTIKIRKGFGDDIEAAVTISRIAEECGVSAIALHGRTREQYYSGEADWDIIKKVKNAVSIPVIGNGDVNSVESYERMRDYTGCDGVMIGRAARGNPWIFKQIKDHLEGRAVEYPQIDEIRDMILYHLEQLCVYKGEFTGVREMRKHIGWYTQGLPHSAKVRRNCNMIDDYDEMCSFIMEKLK